MVAQRTARGATICRAGRKLFEIAGREADLATSATVSTSEGAQSVIWRILCRAHRRDTMVFAPYAD